MPNKILIIGTSASGKTTFARKLKDKVNLPLYFMDEIMWKPGWDYIGDDATNLEVRKIISNEKWLLEGWLDKKIQLEVFNSADKILYLHYSPWVTSWRYVKRFINHRKNPRPEIPGCPEKFSLEILWRVFKRKEMYWVDRHLKQIDTNKIIYLNSPKKAKLYLENICKK